MLANSAIVDVSGGFGKSIIGNRCIKTRIPAFSVKELE
jgi:hypothetical protein